MATVHRAHDQVLDRVVAIKMLHPHLAHDPAFLDRFRREARAAGQLAHPNVVTVHDWGETDDGAYLVLQLVEGCSVRDLLRERGRLGLDETLTVLGAAAAGLGAAHESGLVHRDVKPENLLIGRDGIIRITDFGLARAAAAATSTFGPDVLMGSPHYLSPEAVRGEPLDPRADVYALGVILYESLTGRPPHEGDSPFATAMAHTERPVPAPSLLRPEVPEALDALVVRATSIDPERRPVDATAFAVALEAALVEVQPVHIRPVYTNDHPGELPVDDNGDEAAPRNLDDWTAILTEESPSPEQLPTLDVAPRRRYRTWFTLLVVLALIGGSAVGGYLLWDRVLAPLTPVPAVVGTAGAEATEQLERLGFSVQIAAERPHDLTTPVDHVLTLDPPDVARLGTTVTLVLSGGPRQVRVDEVAGLARTDALDLLRRAGFVPRVEEVHDTRVPAGDVVSIAPPAGTPVDEGSELTVVVSLGPGRVTVPDLRGLRVEEAVERLADLDLEVEIVRRGGFRALLRPDRVYDQDPLPHATVDAGDTLVLYAYE